MSDSKIKLYRFAGLHWDVEFDINGNAYSQIALCPRRGCSRQMKSVSFTEGGIVVESNNYRCSGCDFKITLTKPIREMVSELLDFIEAQKYKDAEIISIDGELIRVQREEIQDNDYWIDVKLSKNKKGEEQLMVLAGKKEDKTKTQLFLEPGKERLAFDQNNHHPSEVFAKVIATFKKSTSEMKTRKDKK